VSPSSEGATAWKHNTTTSKCRPHHILAAGCEPSSCFFGQLVATSNQPVGCESSPSVPRGGIWRVSLAGEGWR
jgi:hypothetical protein